MEPQELSPEERAAAMVSRCADGECEPCGYLFRALNTIDRLESRLVAAVEIMERLAREREELLEAAEPVAVASAGYTQRSVGGPCITVEALERLAEVVSRLKGRKA